MALIVAPSHAQDGFGLDGFGLDDEEAGAGPARPPRTGPAARAYRDNCAPCHGLDGQGAGPAARWLDPPPRNFTRGEYKWRSTPTGRLPTDADLLRTIDAGVFGTAMPAWKLYLPEETRLALVQYIKAFSARFAEEEIEPTIEIPEVPEVTPESVEIGRRAYEKYKCLECHGPAGAGDGPAARTLKDSQDRPIQAHDFTKGFIKAGSTPEAIYKIYMTGLDGTPMPSFAQTISEEERWPLVFFTLSLHRERGVLDYLFGPLEEQPR